MQKRFRQLTRIELVLIFLVILAGSVVRMTGSGMGCPDWPKCFGYYIPPTERADLEWKPQHDYKKGQIIITEERLRVAQSDFTSGEALRPENWEPYTRHDYAHFNPAHTWTEYINRLLGAASGVPMLLLFLTGIYYARQNWRPLALSFTGLVLLGFEAWLGKLVVDGNLIPGSITIHMFGALGIVAVLLVLLGLHTDFRPLRPTQPFRKLLPLLLLLMLVQIAAGTQVREAVDWLQKAGLARQNWIDELDWTFYFHRSFSILITGLAAWLWYQNRRHALGFREMPWIMALILTEVGLGILLTYAGMPAWAQPLHLLLSCLVLALLLWSLIRLSRAPKSLVVEVQ